MSIISGCKIKALRAKTNTYIKTPVRGEEPVFVVTGRKEDVGMAKREILSAADHFSQIRASRRNSTVSGGTAPVLPGTTTGTTVANSLTGPPSPNAPGQVTIQVRVPYRVVGLVVGPKGATIKRIQQQTHTYIVTPSRDKEPVFEVTGLPENVDKARQEIESHIALRTGGVVDSQNEDDFHSNGVDSGFHELNGGSEIPGYNKIQNGFNSAFTNYHNAINGNAYLSRNQDNTIFNFPTINQNGSTKITDFIPVTTMNNGLSSYSSYSVCDNDEGIGGSPSFDPIMPSPSLWPEFCDNRNSNLVSNIFSNTNANGNSTRRSSSLGGITTNRLSPTLSDSPPPLNGSLNGSSSSSDSATSSPPDHSVVRRIHSDPLASTIAPFGTSFSTCSTSGVDASLSNSISASIVATTSNGNVSGVSCPVQVPSINGRPRRQCLMCSESDIVAALVPCGHNLFCMECANLIVEKPLTDRSCPVCQQAPTQAIRIFS